MDQATAKAKAVEVADAAEVRGALWKRIWAAPYGHDLPVKWGVFGETQTGLRYRWNEVDNKFYYWGA